MKYLVCPDKFKGSLSAQQVCEVLAEGIAEADPEGQVVTLPLADGGDGSVDILADKLGLERREVRTTDPLGRMITSYFFTDEKTAYIELASASGLALLKPHERDCLVTSTYGTGIIIREAIALDCKEIKLFIGGSATNDAAVGIASALGYRFLDREGNEIAPTGENLLKITSISPPPNDGSVSKVRFEVICDVTNPFAGPDGAAHVYARQKGADDHAVNILDDGLQHFAEILTRSGLPDVMDLPGAGAAGGVGGGMAALFSARLVRGVDLFMTLFDLERRIEEADVIITGEGQVDSQSFQGKVVGEVCSRAAGKNKDVIIVCGQKVLTDKELGSITAEVHTIVERAGGQVRAIENAAEFLVDIGRDIGFERTRNRTRAEVIQFYNNTSALWVKIWGEHMHHGYYGMDGKERKDKHRAQRDLVHAILYRLGLVEPKRILDAGCGVGAAGRLFARRFGSEVLGVTISPVQAEMGTRFTRDEKLQKHMTIRCMDLFALGPAQGVFDLIWCIECLEHILRKQRLLEVLFRRLLPGGKFAAATWCLARPVSDLSIADKKLIERIYDAFKWPTLITRDALEQQLSVTGFSKAQLEDWSPAVVPFWSAVRCSAFDIQNLRYLRLANLTALRGAWHMKLLQRAYRRGLLQYTVVIAERPD